MKQLQLVSETRQHQSDVNDKQVNSRLEWVAVAVLARRSRSKESRPSARKDGNRGTATSIRECSAMNMRPSKSAFLRSLFVGIGSSRGLEILNHSEKSFNHRVDVGIMVLHSWAAPNAAAEMKAVRSSKMFFNISFVWV